MSQSDNFFEEVYKNVDKDNLASIPWATLDPNTHLVTCLGGKCDMQCSGRALVIGCGLGDDAQALAKAGYEVDAIDISPTAIEMAKERFPLSGINFKVEDIFKLPPAMFGVYDFVFESRTIQSLNPKFRDELIEIIAGLVVKGGELIVHTNIQNDSQKHGGPPWPLYRKELLDFEKHGLKTVYQNEKMISRPVAPYDAVVCFRKTDIEKP